MIRCDPGGSVDVAPGEVHVGATNGFFVACFVRGEPDDAASDAEPAAAETALTGKRKRNKEKKLKQKKRKREEAEAAKDEPPPSESEPKRRAPA
jgi:hypothetical protein